MYAICTAQQGDYVSITLSSVASVLHTERSTTLNLYSAPLLTYVAFMQAAANYYPQTYDKAGKCVTANRGSAALKPAYSSIL